MGKVHLIQPVWESRALDVLALAENRDWGLDSLKITEQTWENQGEGVLYVVGDTGACTPTMHRDSKEPEFAENFTSSSTPLAVHDHGMHVAGTVIAQHNDWGYRGVAQHSGYGSLKLLDDRGSNTTDNIIRGYRWLMNWWVTRNAAMKAKYHTCVLNLSLGGSRNTETTKAINDLFEVGIVVFAAMGNSGQKLYESPGVDAIGVAALDNRDKRATFSTYNEFTDVACPGVNTVSFLPNHKFGEKSGTSMACPYAAGLACLTLSSNRDPNLRTHDGLIEYWTAKEPFDVEAPGKDEATGLGKPNVNEANISPLFNFGL